MGNKNRLSYMKKLKERTRKEKAAEKMARRQGKTERPTAEEERSIDPAEGLTSS
jgi:hypothetical protein